MDRKEVLSESRFKHLIVKLKHYVPSVDGWDEDGVKAEIVREMWKILENNQCQWDSIIPYILEDWVGGPVGETLFTMIQFLHKERGAPINGKYSGEPNEQLLKNRSNLYLAVETRDPKIVSWFLEKGVTVFDERYFERIIIPHWNIFPDEEAIVMSLLKVGVPLPHPQNPYLETSLAMTHRVIEIVGEKWKLQERCAELEADLTEAKQYIVELECRPPELGGPEYEAGRERWERKKEFTQN